MLRAAASRCLSSPPPMSMPPPFGPCRQRALEASRSLQATQQEDDELARVLAESSLSAASENGTPPPHPPPAALPRLGAPRCLRTPAPLCTSLHLAPLHRSGPLHRCPLHRCPPGRRAGGARASAGRAVFRPQQEARHPQRGGAAQRSPSRRPAAADGDLATLSQRLPRRQSERRWRRWLGGARAAAAGGGGGGGGGGAGDGARREPTDGELDGWRRRQRAEKWGPLGALRLVGTPAYRGWHGWLWAARRTLEPTERLRPGRLGHSRRFPEAFPTPRRRRAAARGVLHLLRRLVREAVRGAQVRRQPRLLPLLPRALRAPAALATLPVVPCRVHRAGAAAAALGGCRGLVPLRRAGSRRAREEPGALSAAPGPPTRPPDPPTPPTHRPPDPRPPTPDPDRP